MIYAIITDGACTNIIEADAEFAAQIGAVELPTGYGINDQYDGQAWIKVDPPMPAEPVDQIAALESRVASLQTELTAVQAELAALKGE